MLESSLWDWMPERHIFITALLMAKPFELKEPQPQIAVDKLDPTGWIVPPGKYGLVKASGVMLIKKALGLSTADCLDEDEDSAFSEALRGLEILGLPDDDSRSRAFDGRRLVRIDGGYLVLNYQRYRDKDHTATERKQRQRQREKEATSHAPVTRDERDSHGMSHDVTQAEAEAYKKEAEVPKRTSSAGFPAAPRGAIKEEGDFLTTLRSDPLYAHVDIPFELEKARRWCERNRRVCTQRFFENWISKVDRPVGFKPETNGHAAADDCPYCKGSDVFMWPEGYEEKYAKCDHDPVRMGKLAAKAWLPDELKPENGEAPLFDSRNGHTPQPEPPYGEAETGLGLI